MKADLALNQTVDWTSTGNGISEYISAKFKMAPTVTFVQAIKYVTIVTSNK